MDLLDRTLQQVSEAEQEIYDELVDSENEDLQRIDNGEQGKTLFNSLSLANGLTPLENYEICRRVAEAKGDSDVVNAEKSLKSLLSARAGLLAAKATVQEQILN